jgi:hypothetical protein
MGAENDLLGIFADEIADALYVLRRLLSRDTHDFHQLGRHFGCHLILNTARAMRIRFEKNQDFFFVDTGLFETVEELTKAHFTTQLADPGQEFKSPARSPQ